MAALTARGMARAFETLLEHHDMSCELCDGMYVDDDAIAAAREAVATLLRYEKKLGSEKAHLCLVCGTVYPATQPHRCRLKDADGNLLPVTESVTHVVRTRRSNAI